MSGKLGVPDKLRNLNQPQNLPCGVSRLPREECLVCFVALDALRSTVSVFLVPHTCRKQVTVTYLFSVSAFCRRHDKNTSYSGDIFRQTET